MGFVSIDLTKFLLVKAPKCCKSVNIQIRTNSEKNNDAKPQGEVSLVK